MDKNLSSVSSGKVVTPCLLAINFLLGKIFAFLRELNNSPHHPLYGWNRNCSPIVITNYWTAFLFCSNGLLTPIKCDKHFRISYGNIAFTEEQIFNSNKTFFSVYLKMLYNSLQPVYAESDFHIIKQETDSHYFKNLLISQTDMFLMKLSNAH